MDDAIVRLGGPAAAGAAAPLKAARPAAAGLLADGGE
jgi:hypothetical protein